MLVGNSGFFTGFPSLHYTLLKEFMCTEKERVVRQNFNNKTTDHYNQPCHTVNIKKGI